jgi:hypothetical protein
VPVDLLEEWIDESYRAQAPKRLSARLPPFGAGASIGGELDDDAPAKPAATARPQARRSTVQREPAAAGAVARGSKRPAARKAASRASAGGAEKAAAVKARAAKVPGAARAASKRATVRGASTRPAKREGVSPRAAKRPAKKRARARA